MQTIFSWILTVGGVALVGAGGAGYFKPRSSLHAWWPYLVIGGAALVAVGFYLAREAKVVQHTTMMLQQKQKRKHRLLVRVIVLAAAAVAGYLLIGR